MSAHEAPAGAPNAGRSRTRLRSAAIVRAGHVATWRPGAPVRPIVLAAAAVAVLHAVGWGTLLIGVDEDGGATTLGLSIGVTAYLLGIRHAFDADHIAAIDNSTRNLMQRGRAPAAVGFWFSCGHSTVVLALTIVLAIGAYGLAGPLTDDKSLLQRTTGWFGTIVSTGFLLAVALANSLLLVDLWRMRRIYLRGGDGACMERGLQRRGVIGRLVGHATRAVDRPHRMYAVGLLFGLGFDTATEIALLVLAVSGATSGAPWYAVLSLPVLFAAGMSLCDTVQGSLMSAAYSWALHEPVRRLTYNVVITALSVALALMVAGTQLIGIVAEDRPSWVGDWFGSEATGFFAAALLLAVWAGASLALRRFAR